MSIQKLSRMDLNLLVCFSVLLDEQNVTRAAQRLNLSQSAVSKSLMKLRNQFDDPLFVRTSHGLKPTPKALHIKPKIDHIVNQLEILIEPEKFIPTSSDHCFHIATVESVFPLIFSHFLPQVFHQAPNLTIATHSWADNTFKNLQSGDLDLGITGKDIDINDAKLTMLPPNDIAELEIYQDSTLCVVRKDHPILANQQWDLATYLSLRHVQVRCDGNDRWLLDYRLADLGHQRDIAIIVPDFNSAANLCTYTDLVFTAPRHFIELVSKQLNLEILPLPLPFPPMAYTLFWHRDRANEPALTWLRNIIEEKTLHFRTIALQAEKE
ncbi:LysR substrate-binding domain-containing protein [Vibrio sp. S4M6]|uniref:LysR substrate-binding domain-containing protein n=1 Tax=Vibrio sinus TaxID=2946865 RepID=UPI00202AC213|nr:LysR substrate-binding domain-containing protein [Vibrio sinus]MCL9782860.1 LysR substrate-binding domain-containing protein [Vibrio sinus]